MRSPSGDARLICASCEGPIAGRAEFHAGLAFCCAGCVVGGPCTCSYDLPEDDSATVDPVGEDAVAVAV